MPNRHRTHIVLPARQCGKTEAMRQELLAQGREMAAIIHAAYADKIDRAAMRGNRERLVELDQALKHELHIALAPYFKLLAMLPAVPLVIDRPPDLPNPTD